MNIGIVGLGLIGGSLAIDFQTQGHRVFGVSRRAATCEQAIARQIVDQASPDLSLMAEAEVVFLCPPIGAIVPLAQQLIPHLQPNTILTDVGSVKQPIVQALSPLWPNFIGGHPMAGTAAQGLDAAQPNLFAGNPYVLTPTPEASLRSVDVVSQLARSLQASLYQCHPADHDQAVAWISHLPVYLSAALIAACLEEPNPTVRQLAQDLASSGFRDTSRVGGGNPELGTMMAQHNRHALLSSLQHYQKKLADLINHIEQEDWNNLTQELQRTQQERPHFIKPDSTNSE